MRDMFKVVFLYRIFTSSYKWVVCIICYSEAVKEINMTLLTRIKLTFRNTASSKAIQFRAKMQYQ